MAIQLGGISPLHWLQDSGPPPFALLPYFASSLLLVNGFPLTLRKKKKKSRYHRHDSETSITHPRWYGRRSCRYECLRARLARVESSVFSLAVTRCRKNLSGNKLGELVITRNRRLISRPVLRVENGRKIKHHSRQRRLLGHHQLPTRPVTLKAGDRARSARGRRAPSVAV
jgi:hypothetical protein